MSKKKSNILGTCLFSAAKYSRPFMGLLPKSHVSAVKPNSVYLINHKNAVLIYANMMRMGDDLIRKKHRSAYQLKGKKCNARLDSGCGDLIPCSIWGLSIGNYFIYSLSFASSFLLPAHPYKFTYVNINVYYTTTYSTHIHFIKSLLPVRFHI